jgi:hypothetical protein
MTKARQKLVSKEMFMQGKSLRILLWRKLYLRRGLREQEMGVRTGQYAA